MLRLIIASALLAALSQPTFAFEITCRVVGIADGDTLSCLTSENRQIKVRLAEIDAPEKAQAYGTRSRQALSDYVFGKEVTLIVLDNDRYGRAVARVKVGPTDVNAEMVRSGSAWAYRDYLQDETLLNLEAAAKHYKRGIWSLPLSEQKAPWDWRKEQRGVQPKQQPSFNKSGTAPPSTAGFSCAAIKSCGQMSSCAEARYQLQQCGNPRIDGDRDGIPCEALCR